MVCCKLEREGGLMELACTSTLEKNLYHACKVVSLANV